MPLSRRPIPIMAEENQTTPDPEAAAPPPTDGAAGEARPNAAVPAPPPAPPAPTAQEVADLKDKLLRALADAENVRRRAERDVADARQYGVTSFAREMLQVGDNLRRALDAVP